MQISEISAAALGGLRGLGLAQGDVEAKAAAADAALTQAVEAAAVPPPVEAPGSGSTNFDLAPPTFGPSITSAATSTGLTGRKLTLDLDTKVAAAIKRPEAAAKLVSKVKSAKGKVRVTPKAAKAIVKAIAKVSPAAAQQAATTLAPAVAAAAPAAAAAPKNEGALVVEEDSSKMRRWLIWGGIGVAVLGVAFLFLRRRSSAIPTDAVRAQLPIQTQGLSRYDHDGYVTKKKVKGRTVRRTAGKKKKSSKK